MTLEQAIELANSGDHNAILKLASYYYNGGEDHERDCDEAYKWYVHGAKLGYADCMHLASLLGDMLAHASRKITGSAGIEVVIEQLNEALYWAKQAVQNGVIDAKETINEINGELGVAYFLKGQRDESPDDLSFAIKLLKPIYKNSSDKELTIYLALALHRLGDIVGYTDENNVLEHKLLTICAEKYFGEVIHSDIAAMYLGVMYTEGRGCSVDYDKAVYYLQKAHNSGFDCSDMLSLFRKKLFGGYTLKD